jgi:2-oxoglutarate ferredoxin oxidoreductase subunit gamma
MQNLYPEGIRVKNNWELIVSGAGGQGAILAGIILAAAALEDGYNVIQTQSYGPEARGGASRAEVLISTEELAYPKVQNCNLMVAMTQEALDKYSPMLGQGGTLITDQEINTNAVNDSIKVYKAPIFESAQALERPMVANILVLGFLNTIAQIVSPKALSRAIQARVPAASVDINMTALSVGIELGTKLK